MAEYIEREAALKANCYFCSAYLEDDSPCVEKCADFMKFIEIPAADVRPVVRGKWVKATGMMPPEYCGLHICSECGHYAGKKPPYGGREMLSDYCPHCGANMREES